VNARLPALGADVVVPLDQGWDSEVYVVDDEWIVRVPRRPEVERRLETELRLLPELAPTLPAAVPAPEEIVVAGRPAARHRIVRGQPLGADAPATVARDLGRFLSALHRFPLARAEQVGVPGGEGARWRAEYGRLWRGFRSAVLPRLARDERTTAQALFEGFLAEDEHFRFSPALIHADLGPEHVLCTDDERLAGVIDWTDARLGDPALDLAWPLNGTNPEFRRVLLAAYDGALDPTFEARAAFYHRIGPWYEVVYGLEEGRPHLVETGLAGVRKRLPPR
jgi:aminoglycoside phosphotransferase (APT) family kinase protein